MLGRVLDQLYRTGLNQIFMSVVLEAVKIFRNETPTVHLDSSSFHVHGDYHKKEDECTEDIEPKTVRITYGYSRDKRPDLKQFLMDLICTNDADVPLWMRIGSGNESDQKQFVPAIKEFKSQLNFDSLIVADSALYQYENLQLLTDIKWLSRVPVRIKAAHKLVQEIDSLDFTPSQMKGYSYQELKKTYGGIQQRWLIVESQLRRESDLKTLDTKIQKERVELNKKLRTLKSQKFACIPDAETATRKLLKKFLYHELKQINVQQVESKSESCFPYEVQAKVSLRESTIEAEKKRAGRFILATNVLDRMEL
ncbi:IS1634 family transposase, partial [Dapis sp. BLCC M126]|uniref:IS1634 family transposase n=1 Tax=Dapis sp. BLCC M126 TaxID=3400189 RepID=UPI003CEFD293